MYISYIDESIFFWCTCALSVLSSILLLSLFINVCLENCHITALIFNFLFGDDHTKTRKFVCGYGLMD